MADRRGSDRDSRGPNHANLGHNCLRDPGRYWSSKCAFSHDWLKPRKIVDNLATHKKKRKQKITAARRQNTSASITNARNVSRSVVVFFEASRAHMLIYQRDTSNYYHFQLNSDTFLFCVRSVCLMVEFLRSSTHETFVVQYTMKYQLFRRAKNFETLPLCVSFDRLCLSAIKVKIVVYQYYIL